MNEIEITPRAIGIIIFYAILTSGTFLLMKKGVMLAKKPEQKKKVLAWCLIISAMLIALIGFWLSMFLSSLAEPYFWYFIPLSAALVLGFSQWIFREPYTNTKISAYILICVGGFFIIYGWWP